MKQSLRFILYILFIVFCTGGNGFIYRGDINIKIISCRIQIKDGLSFSKFDLQEVNLFVGLSGSGKSRLINTLFNIARFAIGREGCILGEWEIKLEHENKFYFWEYEGEYVKEHGNTISKEIIKICDHHNGDEKILVNRQAGEFKFDTKALPKLNHAMSSINLLKEEDLLKPLFEGWSKVIRRDFSRDELNTASVYTNVPLGIEKNLSDNANKNKGLYELFNHNLNLRLYLMQQYCKKEYDEIINKFKSTFPLVTNCSILDLNKITGTEGGIGFTPVFAIRESGVHKDLPLQQLSSGMIKVLLILTDVMTLPDGAIYEMDEYENSLGVNAIDFLPTLLLEHRKNKQFLITSHHPYLINQMPVSNWYVLSREGLKVNIKYGEEVVKQYGKSSQQAFTQLINDPFYNPDNK